MSVTVTAKVAARVRAQRLETLITGINDTIDFDFPVFVNGSVVVPNYLATLIASKLYLGNYALSASTPLSIDLAALSGGKGDTSFSDVVAIDVVSTEDPASGRLLTVGNEGSSAEWFGPFGAAGRSTAMEPGTSLLRYRLTSPGWSVGARHLLKVDPGANPHNFLLIVIGN